jgi:hypothetical protein
MLAHVLKGLATSPLVCLLCLGQKLWLQKVISCLAVHHNWGATSRLNQIRKLRENAIQMILSCWLMMWTPMWRPSGFNTFQNLSLHVRNEIYKVAAILILHSATLELLPCTCLLGLLNESIDSLLEPSSSGPCNWTNRYQKWVSRKA